jgi:hypothetical protein
MSMKSLEQAPLWRRLLPLAIVLPTISGVLSAAITWINLGAGADFTAHWLRAWLSALPVMPLGVAVMVALDRLTAPRLQGVPVLAARLLLALLTAVVMETLMATVVTLSNRGLGADFPQWWAQAFTRSLPLGLVIGLLMGFVVKPRLQRWAMQGVPA